MKQCASTVTALPFVLRDRLWLVFILMLSLLTPPKAHAEYAPDENNNPIWAGADAEPAEGPDWSDDEGDSVPNWLENYFETATWLADTDSDGLSDWDEIFGTGTNPVLWDTNGNGLSDADDLIQPPDAGNVPPQPTADDFDGDGLPDLWELAYALNAYDPSDAAADPDDDSLTNLEEYQHATDPNTWNDAAALVSSGSPPGTTADEDQDGLPDLWELANGLNPNDGPSESGWGPTNPFTNGNVRVKGEATQEWDLEVIPLQENPPGLDFIPSGSSILIIRKIKTVRYETIP